MRSELAYRRKRDAMDKLNRAFEYLRPRMQGESLQSRYVPTNAEAEAGSILVRLITEIAFDRDRMRQTGIVFSAIRT
jgi:hypothetical protein